MRLGDDDMKFERIDYAVISSKVYRMRCNEKWIVKGIPDND